MDYTIPADVPQKKHALFRKNYAFITRKKKPILLLAADQKIEHLNNDFVGDNVDEAAAHPEHIFAIASQTTIGALATQFGLIARYGQKYPKINYVIKLNSKTNLIPSQYADPISAQLWSVDDVVNFQKTSVLTICGVGYTVYLGSCFESTMLSEAAHVVYQAHQEGLVTILWVYPRGKYVTQTSMLLAGAAGVANALGADFVKLSGADQFSLESLKQAVNAAGNTKILLAGGAKIDQQQLLKLMDEQLKHGVSGFALGRNLFQRSLPEAQELVGKITRIMS
jgi:DhnA family fructose-bisphosphate aldolase class Ia